MTINKMYVRDEKDLDKAFKVAEKEIRKKNCYIVDCWIETSYMSSTGQELVIEYATK